MTENLPQTESSSALPHTSPAPHSCCCRSPSGPAWPPPVPSAGHWAPLAGLSGPPSLQLAGSLQPDFPSAAASARRSLLLSGTPATGRLDSERYFVNVLPISFHTDRLHTCKTSIKKRKRRPAFDFLCKHLFELIQESAVVQFSNFNDFWFLM